MHTVNIHKAKTHLSRLVDEAADGKPFIIAKAGKPLVKVTALDAPTANQIRRLGFLSGSALIPKDFDSMGSGEITRLFNRKK
jgi:prevent-host-death family protein